MSALDDILRERKLRLPENVKKLLERELMNHPEKLALLVPFAVSKYNPVKAVSVDEAVKYLNMLYTPEGRHVKYERSGNATVGRGKRLDEYTLTFETGGVNKTLKIYIDSFADENSTKAPEGLQFYDEDPEALFVLGLSLYDSDRKQAVSIWKRAAEHGNSDSMFRLGRIMYQAQKYPEALKYFTMAAGQGHSKSIYNLALMYSHGYGVHQDFAKALEYYTLAANKGNSQAQHSLGYIYYSGEGVEKNITKAIDLWYKAAFQGYAPSQNNLAFMFRNGHGVSRDYSEALKWYRKAADQDNPDALFDLAGMYERGEGVMRDVKQAVKLYSRAKELGHKEASEALERLRYLHKYI